PADRTVEHVAVVSGKALDERIACVDAAVIAVAEDAAVQLIRSGLGKDFNTPVAKTFELRGKRVLVDDDLADGRLGRKLTAGESIDINLATVGPGGGSGERLKLIGKLIGIIGERINILAFNHDGTGIGVGFRAYVIVAVAGDIHLLLRNGQSHRNIGALVLSGFEGEGRGCVERKTRV